MMHPVKKRGVALTTVLSLFTSIGALAASSSCCALPLVFSSAGLGGAWLGGVRELIGYQAWFLGGAVLTLALGWVVALRPSISARCGRSLCRSASSRFTFGVLGLSTVLVALAAAWSWVEPALLAGVAEWRAGAA